MPTFQHTSCPPSECFLAGGFKDNLKAVSVSEGHIETLPLLFADHEEADTRLLLHAKEASIIINHHQSSEDCNSVS